MDQFCCESVGCECRLANGILVLGAGKVSSRSGWVLVMLFIHITALEEGFQAGLRRLSGVRHNPKPNPKTLHTHRWNGDVTSDSSFDRFPADNSRQKQAGISFHGWRCPGAALAHKPKNKPLNYSADNSCFGKLDPLIGPSWITGSAPKSAPCFQIHPQTTYLSNDASPPADPRLGGCWFPRQADELFMAEENAKNILLRFGRDETYSLLFFVCSIEWKAFAGFTWCYENTKHLGLRQLSHKAKRKKPSHFSVFPLSSCPPQSKSTSM